MLPLAQFLQFPRPCPGASIPIAGNVNDGISDWAQADERYMLLVFWYKRRGTLSGLAEVGGICNHQDFGLRGETVRKEHG